MSAAIVLIHGRGPKPRKDLLLECWKEFLPPATAALPIDMVHWVDLFGYNPPVTPDDQHDCEHLAGADLPDLAAQAFRAAANSKEVLATQRQLSGQAFGWGDFKDAVIEKTWRAFTGISGNQFAVDAQNFFSDIPALRNDSRQRLKDAIAAQRAAGHEVMVIAHSFGTIVAYEAARELQNREIHTLVTIGSPLAWCYDTWDKAKPPQVMPYFSAREFPRNGLRFWWNVYDPGDPVATAMVLAAQPQIATEYRRSRQPVILDCPIANTYATAGDAGSNHDFRGYLQSAPVQRAIELFLLEAGA